MSARSRNVSSCVLAVFCTLILAEIITRLFLTSPSNQIYDPVFGWKYRPHSEILHTKEGFARNRVNSIGLNDTELNVNAKLKVLVLGDSFVEAVQVPQPLNFTSLLEKAIPDSEFINAGRSDANAAHFMPLIAKFADLQLDAIVAMISASDIAALFSDEIDIVRRGRDIVALHVRPPQKDVIKKYLEPLLRRSAFATYMARRAKPVLMKLIADAPKPQLAPVVNAAPATASSVSYTEEKVEVMTFILRSMAREAPVTMVYLPQITFKPDGVAAETEISGRYERILQQACKAAQVRCIDPTDYLRRSYQESGNPPFGFRNTKPGRGHLNTLGHQAIADALLDSTFSNYRK